MWARLGTLIVNAATKVIMGWLVGYLKKLILWLPEWYNDRMQKRADDKLDAEVLDAYKKAVATKNEQSIRDAHRDLVKRMQDRQQAAKQTKP